MDQIFNSYAYEALDPDSREIRVFELFPGTGSEQVFGKLIKTSLHDALSYDTLSYEWGDPTVTSTISLGSDVNFKVTTSLETALRNIRRPDHTIIIWIDAICINQQDVQERNHQVAMMREIYSNATTVRVWINQEIDINSPAFRALPALNESSKPEDLGEDPNMWAPIAEIFKDSYWDRLWVQQELVFATDIIVHCHGGIIPGLSLGAFQWLVILRNNNTNTGSLVAKDGWADLSRGMKLARSPSRHLLWWRKMLALKQPVNSISLLPPEFAGQSIDWDKRLAESSQPLAIPIYLLGAMRNAQRLKVTDPLDRVYGMLNLTIDCQPGDIDIDYKKTAAEAYTDVARFIAVKYRYLQFLPYAHLPLKNEQELLGRPSWVPNWNGSAGAGYFGAAGSASGSLRALKDPFPANANTPTLRVKGLRVDTVEPLTTVTDILQPVTELLKLINMAIGSDLQGAELGQALWRTITALAKTLTGPSISQSNISHDIFSDTELFLYTTVILRAASIMACEYGSISPTFLRFYDLEDFRTKSDEILQEWFTSLHLLSSLDRSIVRSIDLQDMLQHGFSFDPAKFRDFIPFVKLTLSDSTLTISRKGSFIITENIPLEENDEIWVLFGCSKPIILRLEQDHWRVVSPAYVTGFMKGEAVLGIATEDEIEDGQRVGTYEARTIQLC